jgi:alginate O-acetyltransferase complex protein AlgI
MLFNSHAFIFVFLPVTLLGFFCTARLSHRLAAAWLAAASIVFYGYWNPNYVWLLLVSIAFNYAMGRTIAHSGRPRATVALAAALIGNLCLLGYYKYTNFFISSARSLVGVDWTFHYIILPLGISFFTFTQIAFLVDVYRRIAKEYNFIHYALFVSFFPHLIAGPVLHHKQMMPQFDRPDVYRFNYGNTAVGLTIFLIGLFKKVILADGVAVNVGLIFDNPTAAMQSGFVETWCVAISYSLQLYFDFSGYSDMAIGASRLFGIVLPLNFNSPLKSVNIIEFWRRWHMTLSQFLKDYLYIPLGGNRYGTIRRYVNLLLTMLLGGLWHGAGWTFIIWGALHGLFLVVNHVWHAVRRWLGQDPLKESANAYLRSVSVFVTFTAVTVSFVIFRASDLGAAVALFKGMTGKNDYMAYQCVPTCGPMIQWLIGIASGAAKGVFGIEAYLWAGGLLMLAWFAPNTQEIMSNYRPVLEMPKPNKNILPFVWRPSLVMVGIVWLIGLVAIVNLTKQSPFLYFQF